jgi:hypothetical protein
MNRLGDNIGEFFRSIPPPKQAAGTAPKRGDEAAALEQRRRHLLARHIRPTDVERLLQPERLVPTVALLKVQGWLADVAAKRVLVLAGEKDSGKTTAASWAAAADPGPADLRWLARGAGLGRYIEAELLRDAWLHHRTVKDADGIEHDKNSLTGMNREQLVTCWLLVIDDVGQESGALLHEVAEAVDVICRLRCDRRLRTVLTTNMVADEGAKRASKLAARYAETGRSARLMERLTEHGLWVDCPREYLRRPGAIEERLRTTLAGGAVLVTTPGDREARCA